MYRPTHRGVAGSQRWADGAGMLRVLVCQGLSSSRQTGKAHTCAVPSSLPCAGLTWPSPLWLC